MDPENNEVRAPQRREGRKQDSGMCARARQFSDPQHLVAQELGRMADENADQPKPDGCVNRGFFWDMAILYTPHSSGGRHRRPFSGTVRSSAWLLRSRRRSRTVP